jgi:hypothetical protein
MTSLGDELLAAVHRTGRQAPDLDALLSCLGNQRTDPYLGDSGLACDAS